jgi:hypothetical protein
LVPNRCFIKHKIANLIMQLTKAEHKTIAQGMWNVGPSDHFGRSDFLRAKAGVAKA